MTTETPERFVYTAAQVLSARRQVYLGSRERLKLLNKVKDGIVPDLTCIMCGNSVCSCVPKQNLWNRLL